MDPPEGVRLTVVVDRPVAAYSGLVPAYVAGEVTRDDLEIDVRPLARRAGAAVIVAACERVDADRRLVHVRGRPPLRYDLCSLNLGSTVAGLDTPGVREHAVPTRPIARFLDRVDAGLAAWAAQDALPVVVVGAGAGGIEVAATLEARLRGAGADVAVTVITSSGEILPGAAPAARATVRAHLTARGIAVVTGRRVVAVASDHVTLDDGGTLPSALTCWVTGAVAQGVATRSGLPVDPRGFVKVDAALRVEGRTDLFAAGDCAVLTTAPWVPRAGVYAVREGPVLAGNLEATLAGEAPRPYRPQRDFLSMLNLGDGTAVVSKWGLALRGGWVHAWKHRIDRRFMERFQVLDGRGRPHDAFNEGMPPMDPDAMACGGCAAKVPAQALDDLLRDRRGSDDGVVVGIGDDAALVRAGDGLLAVTTDGFPAFTEDAWLVGRLAAHHAANDLHAKGVRPRFALADLSVPDDGQGEDLARQALAGLQEGLEAEGVALVGGHTGLGPLRVGLTLLGAPAEAAGWWGRDGARVGDALLLTGPLGTGVLWRADGLGRLPGPWADAAIARLLRGQRAAAEALRTVPVHACTDVTGFGLVGHLDALLDASGVSATLDAAALPILHPGLWTLLHDGLRASTAPADDAHPALHGDAPAPVRALALDPQTCGPLLAVVPAAHAAAALDALHAAGHDDAALVGRVTPGRPGPRIHLEAAP